MKVVLLDKMPDLKSDEHEFLGIARPKMEWTV